MTKTTACSCWLLGLLLPTLAAAAPFALTSENPRHSADAADLGPGVIVGSSGQAVYLMNPDYGIDALSASSGEFLWTTREAVKPLAIHQQQLIAQGPAISPAKLEIVILEPADGRLLQALDVALPAGVRGAVDESYSATFEARAVILQEEPFLLWDYTERYAKGIAPAPGEGLEQHRAGAYRLDRGAGRAEAVDPASLNLSPGLPSAVERWADTSEMATRPAPAGELLAATRLSGGRLILQRWTQSGEQLPEALLFSGPYVLDLRTADGAHLIVVERATPGEWLEYRWSVYSLVTGERVGELRSHSSQAWVHVDGRRLIRVEEAYGRRVGDGWVEKPRRLRAVNLDDGRTIWERPLRDPAFRGEFPR